MYTQVIGWWGIVQIWSFWWVRISIMCRAGSTISYYRSSPLYLYTCTFHVLCLSHFPALVEQYLYIIILYMPKPYHIHTCLGTDARVAACKRVRDAGGQLPSAKKGERSTQGWLNGDIALTRWRHIEGVDVIEPKQHFTKIIRMCYIDWQGYTWQIDSKIISWHDTWLLVRSGSRDIDDGISAEH